MEEIKIEKTEVFIGKDNLLNVRFHLSKEEYDKRKSSIEKGRVVVDFLRTDLSRTPQEIPEEE